MSSGTIFDIKEMAVHDGPGVRTTVFLKGCPLRCAWCHNPEGLSIAPQLMRRTKGCTNCGLCRRACAHPECQGVDACLRVCPQNLVSLCGYAIEAEKLAHQLRQSKDALRAMQGGVTFSGGEPLLQPEFLLEALQRLAGMHTAVETSGYAEPAMFAKVMRTADLIILDIKLVDSAAHRKWTGVENAKILANLRQLILSGRAFWARIPLVPGVTDTPQNLRAAAALLAPAKDRVRVELLPYNALAGAKYPYMGQRYAPGFDVKARLRPLQVLLQPFEEAGLACKIS